MKDIQLKHRYGWRTSVAVAIALGISGLATEVSAAEDQNAGFSQVFEAEDASSVGTIVDNKHLGFTGEGFVDYNPNAPGGYIEWTVNVPAEKEYYLVFRYAHAGEADRPAEVHVNDTLVTELPFPTTEEWAEWDKQSVKVPLKQGDNVVRLTATGASGGGNIDHLLVTEQLEKEEVQALELLPLNDVVDGVLQKQLRQNGLLADEQSNAGDEVTLHEFLALVQQMFGVDNELLISSGGLEVDDENPWGNIVEELAKEQHIVPDYLWEELNGDDVLNKQQMAVILGDVLDLIPENKEDKSSFGKLASQGIMNPQSDAYLGLENGMSWEETKDRVREIAAKSGNIAPNVQILRAEKVAEHVLAVTLNGSFEDVNVEDLQVFNGQDEEPIDLKKAALGTDRFGRSVLFYTLPVDEREGFSGDLESAVERADNILSWQMDHGGWSKSTDYSRPWDGKEDKSEWVTNDGVALGMIDNDATVQELYELAEVYAQTGDPRYKEGILKGLEFLFDLQYETGGFAQVYPRRGNYSDMVTFNDNAMVRVLELFDDITEERYPFNNGVVNEQQREAVATSIDLAVDYILNAQIEVNGVLAAWCAQHDPFTFEAVGARSYELPSISGSESVGVIRFLMSREPTDDIQHAIQSAITWFEENKVENTRYVSGGDEHGVYFVDDPDASTWYRFYEIGTNRPIFSGRDGVMKHDIYDIEAERRNGYSWGGSYATTLLEEFYKGKTTTGWYVAVVETTSRDDMERTFVEGVERQIVDSSEAFHVTDAQLVVDGSGKGDYSTVQAAIDAVSDERFGAVEILIKEGVYREVIEVPADKSFITLRGEGPDKTHIVFDNYAGRDNGVGGTLGTSASATMFVRADHVKLEDMTIENDFDETTATEGHQAVALNATGDQLVFRNVHFLGNQDTLLANKGRQYYVDCYIEGDVDFIFGGAQAVFDNCTIHALDRGSTDNNGYITAASTQGDEPFGFLIINSELTSDAPDGTVYLGRPWRPSSNPSAVPSAVFKNNLLGAHIKEEGWTEMGGVQPEDARLYEYNNTGPGAVVNDSRPQLSEEEATKYTIENVLDGWIPGVE
ncbi:pectate lyase [Aureibacillus halotolerans]|uniref:PelA/Pel-15E family pectate lyase n=1 Tax=Aureibacillus halotolerans TaxID=1508390 RepID=A0A4R6TWJ9_9BACI|nr:pectate lyase [Aureibacillus halotolerans]TDQ36215.1 PelA/Pel-15E family pectate lyase [Aureibacillus halotolerans]